MPAPVLLASRESAMKTPTSVFVRSLVYAHIHIIVLNGRIQVELGSSFLSVIVVNDGTEVGYGSSRGVIFMNTRHLYEYETLA